MSGGGRSEQAMTGRVVVADVFRLDRALELDRDLMPPDGRSTRLLPPAVLVIPRGGGPHDPYLVVLDHRGDAGGHLSTRLDFVDYHVVACTGGNPDRGWNDVADVLACAGEESWSRSTRRIATLLGRYPGSEIVICGEASGHVAGVRNGRLIRIVTTTVGKTRDPVAPFGGYGSFLHAWLTAGMPLECLERALVVAGHYIAPRRGRPGRLMAAVRAHVHCAPSPYGRSRPAA